MNIKADEISKIIREQIGSYAVDVTADELPGLGPLGGLHAALLTRAGHEDVGPELVRANVDPEIAEQELAGVHRIDQATGQIGRAHV